MPITTIQEKFAHELRDMYDAEHQFIQAMRKMQDKAVDEKLSTMLAEHIEQTRGQITRLEEVFAAAGIAPDREECMGAKGLIDEATKMMQEAGTTEICDSIIVAAAAKSEHYEMANYADLIDAAEVLKLRKAVKLLTENRDEEVNAARRLERVAPRLSKAAA